MGDHRLLAKLVLSRGKRTSVAASKLSSAAPPGLPALYAQSARNGPGRADRTTKIKGVCVWPEQAADFVAPQPRGRACGLSPGTGANWTR